MRLKVVELDNNQQVVVMKELDRLQYKESYSTGIPGKRHGCAGVMGARDKPMGGDDVTTCTR